MTDDQINTVIASLQGWTKINEVDRGRGVHPEFTNAKDYLGRPMEDPPTWEIPDYCKDLNAMHEAEKTLDYEQAEIFEDELYDLSKKDSEEMDYPLPWRFACVHATARQRAEAFLKTIGKWKEQN